MAIIIMAVHDTVENGRSEFTRQTLECLYDTVDTRLHRLVVIDNGSCQRTKDLLNGLASWWKNDRFINSLMNTPIVITNEENVGTARAINQGLRLRTPDEYAIKIDNDVLIHKEDWVEEMESVMNRMPKIGILGLKRNDLGESTYSVNTDLRSRLIEVPKSAEQPWRVVEECKHIMGTCTMLSPALLEKIGYFYQMNGLYGFDDSLLSVRSTVAGFTNAFLLGIDIDHIDPGGTEYAAWKQRYAGDMLSTYGAVESAYRSGAKDIYYGGE